MSTVDDMLRVLVGSLVIFALGMGFGVYVSKSSQAIPETPKPKPKKKKPEPPATTHRCCCRDCREPAIVRKWDNWYCDVHSPLDDDEDEEEGEDYCP